MVSLTKYQLFSEAGVGGQEGRWRFVLRRDDDSPPLEAGGIEPDVRGERLELLAVVRGLEALDEPSRVVLLSASVYVREGIRYGLEQWRTDGWQWESFGQMVPVKNRDLWQRVDRALEFHQVECRTWRIDPAHAGVPAPHDKAAGRRQALLGRIKPCLSGLIDRSRETASAGLQELERVACL